MKIETTKIRDALDCAQNLREIYFNFFHNEKPFISVNDLLSIVQTNLKKKVTLSFHSDSYVDHTMTSFVVMNDDGSYEICLLSGNTNCWNRFSLCKELFHVVLDAEDHRNADLEVHLLEFRSSMLDRAVEGSESAKNEMITEFAAMQFLFPYGRRLEYAEQIKATPEDRLSDLYENIARSHRVPRFMIEDYLHPSMMEFFDTISWNERSDRK